MKVKGSYFLSSTLPEEIESAYRIVEDLKNRGYLKAGLVKSESGRLLLWELQINEEEINGRTENEHA